MSNFSFLYNFSSYNSFQYNLTVGKHKGITANRVYKCLWHLTCFINYWVNLDITLNVKSLVDFKDLIQNCV